MILQTRNALSLSLENYHVALNFEVDITLSNTESFYIIPYFVSAGDKQVIDNWVEIGNSINETRNLNFSSVVVTDKTVMMRKG